jgi:hypothetical protein
MIIKPIITTMLALSIGSCMAIPAQATPLQINGKTINIHQIHAAQGCKHGKCNIEDDFTATAKGSLKNRAALLGLHIKQGEKIDTKTVQLCKVSQKGQLISARCHTLTTATAVR